MSQLAGRDPEEATAPLVDEARRQLRAPWGRQDRFVATVFLGTGLIFVATLFAASAVACAR